MNRQPNQGVVNLEHKTAVSSRYCRQRSDRTAVVAAFMLSILLAGCGDPNRSKLIGTWEIASVSRISSRLQEAEVEPATISENRMTVEFRSNGMLRTQTMMGSVKTGKEGTWELLSFDESSATARLKCSLEMQETEHDATFLDANTIEMIPPNLAGLKMKLRFTREGNKAPNK
jgi:hypothetical protein